MRSLVAVIVSVCVLVFSGCEHRLSEMENQFERVGDHDVIPEPVDGGNGLFSSKDDAFGLTLGEQFASTETTGWRTKVVRSLRGDARHGDWETEVTNALDDSFVADPRGVNPVETYRRTGQWPLRYALDTGDRLRIIVYSQRTLTRTYSVDDSGHISIPLIGQIYVRGLSTKMVEQRVAEFLAQKYLKDPKVSVEVATYRSIFVLGQVEDAGQFPYVVGMTVEMAAALAGGFSARANEKKFRLSRVYKGRRYTLLVSRNFPVFPGDTVYVRERLF